MSWVTQNDGTSCGPLAAAAALSFMEGVAATNSSLGASGRDLTRHEAKQLRLCQMIDFLALCHVQQGWSLDSETLANVTNSTLRDLIQRGIKRIEDFIKRHSDKK